MLAVSSLLNKDFFYFGVEQALPKSDGFDFVTTRFMNSYSMDICMFIQIPVRVRMVFAIEAQQNQATNMFTSFL